MLNIHNLILFHEQIPEEYSAAHKELLTAAYIWEEEHQAIIAGPIDSYSVIELKNVYNNINISVKKANDFAVFALRKYRIKKHRQ